MLSCHLDRSTPHLGSLDTDIVNGTSGTYTVRYICEMADGTSGPLNVYTQGLTTGFTPLPSLWQTFSYQGDTDSKSYAKSFQFDRDPKNPKIYYVTVTYKPADPGELPDYTNPTTPNGSPIKSEPNPFLRSPVYWWDREVASSIYTTDTNGYAIRNYAGDFYQDLIERDKGRSVLVIEFPVHSSNEFTDLSQKYDQAVNAQAWSFKQRSYPARNVLCKEVSCSPMQIEGSYRYYTVSMRFVFAPLGKTWDVPIPEVGRSYYTKRGDGTYETDADGFLKRTVVDYDVPLNADGTRRSEAQPVLITMVRAEKEIDFNPLTTGNAWNNV
jgi:hypothetical protein